jgi:glutathione S-transferase
LALNPNGQVPTLVVDGTPIFEAVAIMQWLGDRFGVDKKLWPAASDPARLQALAWTTWSYVTLGQAVGRLFMALDPKLGGAAHQEHCKQQIDKLIGVLDGQLAKQPFLLSDKFSLADLIVAGVIGWVSHMGASLDAHVHVKKWLQACTDRPSWRAATTG